MQGHLHLSHDLSPALSPRLESARPGEAIDVRIGRSLCSAKRAPLPPPVRDDPPNLDTLSPSRLANVVRATPFPFARPVIAQLGRCQQQEQLGLCLGRRRVKQDAGRLSPAALGVELAAAAGSAIIQRPDARSALAS